ncbi:hypothetical protein [Calidifontibacter terrae]
MTAPVLPRPVTASTAGAAIQRASARLRDYLDQFAVVDLILGMSMVLVNYPITATVPGSIPIALAVIGIAVFRRPTRTIRWGGLLLLATLVLFGFLIVVSMQAGLPWAQRISKFCLLSAMLIAIVQGRVDFRAMIVGNAFASVVNVPAYYAGLTSDNYPPHLTGLYGDKNVSGMYYALLGLLVLAVLRGRWRYLWLSWSFLAVFLTGSRTSISALAVAVAWWLLRNRVGPLLRLLFAGGGWWLLTYVEAKFAESGVYTDRTSTDWFRHQIDLATQVKMNLTPWHGMGLNEGYVLLGGVRRAWFHDSYAQAFVEGGYPFLFATIGAFALLGVGLLSQRATVQPELLAAEAAVLVVVVCAWKLGETFMTAGAFFALAVAISMRLGEPIPVARQWWRLNPATPGSKR